ncbi:MAG: Minf_1886 family protein [Victivallaceae bacterium]
MQNNELKDKIAHILKRDKTYPADAYEFVSAAVIFTVEQLQAEKHINARQLLEGIKEYAVKQYGPFSGEVLKDWGLRTASDAGKIVFALVAEKALSASEEDSIEDFNLDFDFFGQPDDVAQTVGQKKLKVPIID